MRKPPMVCGMCRETWNIEADEVTCTCGQQLYRVMIGLDGQVIGPPSMPEDVRQQMQAAWEAQRVVAMEPKRPFVLQPDRVAADAHAAFGREAESADRNEFYASWSAFDAALATMSPLQQNVQRKAEIIELERMLRT